MWAIFRKILQINKSINMATIELKKNKAAKYREFKVVTEATVRIDMEELQSNDEEGMAKEVAELMDTVYCDELNGEVLNGSVSVTETGSMDTTYTEQ
jgi:hypothetical protein